MLHRFALLIGGVAALGVIAVAIAGGGLFPAANADNGASSDGLGSQTAAQGPGAQTQATHVKTIVDMVYIAPTLRPKVVQFQALPKVADHEDNESGERGDGSEGSELGDD